MLLIIQVGLAVAATVRGWGGLPWVIFVGVIGLGFLVGLLSNMGPAAINFMLIIDLAATVLFAYMAIAGNEGA